ncbi:MAG: hypothetical protein ACLFPE_11330 [Bacteroidales bacterium]
MEKKRVIKSIENITEDVLEAIKKKYPDGWSNHVQRVNKGNNEFIHVITVDTEDTSYLIKVNVKIDSIEELEKFSQQEDVVSGGDEAIDGDEEISSDMSDDED